MTDKQTTSRADGVDLVAIGGGTGLATLLSGLKAHVGSGGPDPIGRLSAIVAVTDDGGSSGRLRDELQMLPPGDIRNCMVALSEDSNLLSRLFRHRFTGEGTLSGHSFGNLFLAAMAEVTGDFAEAVRLSSEILASKGHIYPATDTNVQLAARLRDGMVVRGETEISKVGSAIERLFLEPSNCAPIKFAIDAIDLADVITVGPGSLYTSILPPLLVEGISEAIGRSNAVKVMICNLMTQPGETDGMSARRHLEVIAAHTSKVRFDRILVNNTPISERQAENYLVEGAEQIGVHGSMSVGPIDGADVVFEDLLEDGEMVRHDPEKLARAVLKTSRLNRDT